MPASTLLEASSVAAARSLSAGALSPYLGSSVAWILHTKAIPCGQAMVGAERSSCYMPFECEQEHQVALQPNLLTT